MSQQRILFLDIETAPNLGYIWAKYEQNVISYEYETFMLAVSYKWSDEKTTHVMGLPDFEGYTPEVHDDSALVQFTLDLLDDADIICGHNLDKFDLRKINAYALVNNQAPPSSYRTIDTLKVARSVGMFNSNSLGDLCKRLGLPQMKGSAGGFGTWLGCLRGDEKAWKTMLKYAKQDVVVLPQLYERLRPWMKNHPTMSYDGDMVCSRCSSPDVTRRGMRYTNAGAFQQFQCKDCGGYSRSRFSEPLVKPALVST